jgi:hypothetical protein
MTQVAVAVLRQQLPRRQVQSATPAKLPVRPRGRASIARTERPGARLQRPTGILRLVVASSG